MSWAKAFNTVTGELIREGRYSGYKTYNEKFPQQYVEFYKNNKFENFDHIDGVQHFILEDDDCNLLYDSRTHEEHEWFEYEDCHFHYDGCTNKPELVWNNGISSSNFPCCQNCYDKRESEQKEINRKYVDITPFNGPNEYGEYYDENSY